MVNNKFKKGIILGTMVLLFLTCMIPQISGDEGPKGAIMVLKGGFGASALIDTYYTGECYEYIPLEYYLTIEGAGVINPGTVSGVAPGRQRTWVRTFLAFGFGSVTIVCKTYQQGRIVEEKSKTGFMIGFFVLAI